MITEVRLPQWLDNLIFEQLGAKYCRSNADMTVIDWDKNDVLNYLGTYFPRSYAESYCIFTDFFEKNRDLYADKTELSIYDFGCGTGGELFGMLDAIRKRLPQTKNVSITAMDGNFHALRLLEEIFTAYKERFSLSLTSKIQPIKIDDFYDLSILDSVMSDQYDIFLTFKAVCEFVTKERFEQQNAYTHIARTFSRKLASDGIMLMADVTSYNNVSQEWLPKMMDAGIMEAKCRVMQRNEGYNQQFSIHHSRNHYDISKIAWRITN